MIKLKEISHFGPRTFDSMFGKVPFGGWKEIRALIKSNPEPEQDTYYEEMFLDLIKRWTIGMDLKDVAQELYNEFDAIKMGADKCPEIFRPKTKSGTPLYRGLSDISVSVESVLRKAKKNDFTITKVGGTTYFKHNKPIQYVPRNPIQSWTSSTSIANYFAKETGVLLMTTQDNDFYFNQKLVHLILGGKYEYEVLHFGQEYNSDVSLLVDAEYFYVEYVRGD